MKLLLSNTKQINNLQSIYYGVDVDLENIRTEILQNDVIESVTFIHVSVPMNPMNPMDRFSPSNNEPNNAQIQYFAKDIPFFDVNPENLNAMPLNSSSLFQLLEQLIAEKKCENILFFINDWHMESQWRTYLEQLKNNLNVKIHSNLLDENNIMARRTIPVEPVVEQATVPVVAAALISCDTAENDPRDNAYFTSTSTSESYYELKKNYIMDSGNLPKNLDGNKFNGKGFTIYVKKDTLSTQFKGVFNCTKGGGN
jgi:hypothetical protein